MGTKHKLERFLPAEGVCVASMFAPITFPPAPVLVFQVRVEDGCPHILRFNMHCTMWGNYIVEQLNIVLNI